MLLFSHVWKLLSEKCCRYYEAIMSLICPDRHASSDLLETQTGLPRETFSSWDVFHWLHNCLNIWFEKSVMKPTCWCLQVVYIIFHVHRLLACQCMLISSKCKIQLRLIGMTLVLLVFGQIKVLTRWWCHNETWRVDQSYKDSSSGHHECLLYISWQSIKFLLKYFGPDHGTRPAQWAGAPNERV